MFKDHKKFADAIVLGMGKKSDPEDEDEDSKDTDDEDSEDSKPGKLGKMLATALKCSDFEAIEEAVKEICSK